MTLEINGVTLHCDVVGEGEPLLWLHGFMGAGEDWRHVFNAPPAGVRLIAPDLRGHGSSTNPSNTFTFRQAALDVLELLRQLDVKRVKAIGLSGGGITLLHMATLEPAVVESMVLVSAPPYFPAHTRALQRQTSEAMFPSSELAAMRKRHQHGEAQIQQLFAQARGFADVYDDVNFTAPYLGMIAARTLVVFGDSDPLYPVSLAFALHSAIPQSHLWVVPFGGHGPIFGNHAATFAATALGFLRQDGS